MSEHKHRFARGDLTAEERLRGSFSVVVCEACDFRMAFLGSLSHADRRWAEMVAHLSTAVALLERFVGAEGSMDPEAVERDARSFLATVKGER